MNVWKTAALLAGNVSAQISGGMLRLTGDSLGNQVLVEPIGTSMVVLTPLDATTTINRQAGPVTLGGYRSGVVLSSGAGDDVFRFRSSGGLFHLGSTVINLGTGNDTLELSRTHSGKTLVVDAGTGNDLVDLRNNHLGVAVLVGGPGFDTLNRVANQIRHRPVIVQFERHTQVAGPTATSDSATVAEGGTVTIDVDANDVAAGAALDPPSVVITVPPTRGTATVNTDGTVTYTHNGSDTTSDSFQYTIRDVNGVVSNAATVSITITPENDAPTISAVADVMTNVNVATGPLSVTLADDITAAASIGLAGTSSNTALVPNANIAITGTGSTRTVVVTPAANQSGTATITLTATDGGGLTATETFIVTVNAAPTISDVANATIDVNTAAGPFNVTVGDDLTAAGSLTLAATSSNAALVPNANIQLGGSGAVRTVLVTPVGNATGSTTITLTVTDANGLTATDTFTVTVNPDTVNASPTISAVADVTTNVNTQAGPLNVTIADQETAAQLVGPGGSVQQPGRRGQRRHSARRLGGADGAGDAGRRRQRDCDDHAHCD